MKTMATKRQIKCDMKFSINWRIVTFLDLVKKGIRILRMFTNI